MNVLKNPNLMCSVVRIQTLIVENMLSKATCLDKNEPLMIYHNVFARFKFVIINSEKKPVDSSIKVNEIIDLIKRSEFAFNIELKNESLDKKTDNAVSKAYTVKIGSGILKGKTPAEILIDTPEQANTLMKHFNWLKDNEKKYPKNKEQMIAIKEAFDLYKENKLNTNNMSHSIKPMNIYVSGFRYNIYKPHEDNTYRIKETKITWNYGFDYPVTIEIKNYDAPLIKKEDGTNIVDVKNRKNTQVNTMSLTAQEWNYIIYMMKVNMRIFENSVGTECIECAKQAGLYNRNNYSHS